jgi:hypothetical protein
MCAQAQLQLPTTNKEVNGEIKKRRKGGKAEK